MSSIVTGSVDATLPQDHAELLLELAVAVHKNAIYPGTHPLLVAAVDNLARRLAAFLETTPTLSIGVARRQLIIEDDHFHTFDEDLLPQLFNFTFTDVRGRVGPIAMLDEFVDHARASRCGQLAQFIQSAGPY